MIDFGHEIRVYQHEIRATVISMTDFTHMPLGIQCRLTHANCENLSCQDWSMLLKDKKVRIRGVLPDGDDVFQAHTLDFD